MAAGAALLQLSVVLLCHAQQDINIQLDNNGNAGYKYDKFGTAARKIRRFSKNTLHGSRSSIASNAGYPAVLCTAAAAFF
jgi:hypothetical protein